MEVGVSNKVDGKIKIWRRRVIMQWALNNIGNSCPNSVWLDLNLEQAVVYSNKRCLVRPTLDAIKPWPKSLRDTAFCYYIITVISYIKGLQSLCVRPPTVPSYKLPTTTLNHKKPSDYSKRVVCHSLDWTIYYWINCPKQFSFENRRSIDEQTDCL